MLPWHKIRSKRNYDGASFIELAQVYMTHQNKIATTLIQTSQNNSPYNAKYIKVTSDEVACPNKQK